MEETDKVDLISCGCGCGQTRPKYDNKGREKTYIYGHSPKGRFVKGLQTTEERKTYLRTLKGEKSPGWRGGRMKPKNCVDCGKQIGYRSIRCPSCINQGEAHSQWKGGRIKRGGYVLIRCENHPRAKNAGKYIREHDLAMEKHIGRYLIEGEVVHHINGIKDDNRLENLQLMNRSEHMRIHTKGRTRKGRILKEFLC